MPAGLTEPRSGAGAVPLRSLAFLVGIGSRFLMSQMSEQTTGEVFHQKHSRRSRGSRLSSVAMDCMGDRVAGVFSEEMEHTRKMS